MDNTDNEEIIVTDISEESEQQPLSGRDAIMQGILENRAEQQQGEIEDKLVDTQEDEEVELDTEPEVEAIEDEFTTVKVNGRTYEVETEKVESAGGIDAYQRNAAATEKQRQVAEREANLKRREAELEEAEKALIKPEPVQEPVVDGEFGREFADQIFDDPEAIAEKINTLESRTRKAEQDALDAKKRLEDKEARDQKKDQESVVKYFWTRHEAIAKDQEFTDALNSRLGAIASENPGFTQEQVIDAAAEQVYSKFNISKDNVQAEKTTPERQNRKPIRAPQRATSRKPPKPEVKQKSPDEIVRELAKSRTPQR